MHGNVMVQSAGWLVSQQQSKSSARRAGQQVAAQTQLSACWLGICWGFGPLATVRQQKGLSYPSSLARLSAL